MNARSLARITVVSALTVGFLPFGTVVGAESVRLATQLGGFSVNVEGQLGDHFGLRRFTVGGAVFALVVLGVVRLARPGYSTALDLVATREPEPVMTP